MSDILGRRVEQPQHQISDFGVEVQEISLDTEDGLVLAAWHVATKSEHAKGTVIILSGIQSPSVTAFGGYAKMLSDAGWDSLLIEMRARSKSEGEETGLGMTEWLDVKAGVAYIKENAVGEGRPIVAMGTSLGAATVLIAAGEVPEIDGVIALSAFSSWADVFTDIMGNRGIPGYFCALERPFITMYLGFHFGFDQLDYTPINGIEKLEGRPALLMHSTEDDQVPFASYQRLMAQAEKQGADVTSYVREGNQHFICYPQYFDTPEADLEFSSQILGFLEENFASQ